MEPRARIDRASTGTDHGKAARCAANKTYVDRLRQLATLLRDADGLAAITSRTCAISPALFGARCCTVSYHATSGRPLVTIDNDRERDDRERLAYLERGWLVDAPLRAMLDRWAVVAFADAMLVPVLDPEGIIVSLRCHELDTASPARRQQLLIAAMLIATRLAQLGITPGRDQPRAGLSNRQREIAELAARGITTAEIGATLAISPNTVKQQLKEVFRRLAIGSRIELVHVLRKLRATYSGVPIGITRQDSVVIARVA